MNKKDMLFLCLMLMIMMISCQSVDPNVIPDLKKENDELKQEIRALNIENRDLRKHFEEKLSDLKLKNELLAQTVEEDEITINERTEMLEVTKKLIKDLQVKIEELAKNNEELAKYTEEMAKTSKELKKQLMEKNKPDQENK